MNSYHNIIYWTQISYESWQFYIAASSEGLCYFGSPNGSFDELAGWVQKTYPKHHCVQDDDALRSYTDEMIRYFNGELEQFFSPLDLKGTPFQLSVWNALSSIPYGHNVSYTEIAEQIGKPKAVRAVGVAIGANPILIAVPCHRVIGKNGALTGYRGGIEMKSRLLQLEQNKNINGIARSVIPQ